MTEPDVADDECPQPDPLEDQEDCLLAVRARNAAVQGVALDTAAEKERLRHEREAALAVGAGEELRMNRFRELKVEMLPDEWETLMVDMKIDRIEWELDREADDR